MGIDLKDNPFDQESLALLRKLPRHGILARGLMTFSRLLAIPILLLGAVGAARWVVLYGIGSEYAQSEDAMMGFLMETGLVAVVLAVGAILWFVPQHYTFNKAPIGSLVEVLFEGLSMKKDVSKIAMQILKQTEGDAEKAVELVPKQFARALASEFLAEISEDQDLATEGARDFEYLKQVGIDTPLLHFGLATCLRIAGQNQKAIDAYKKYLIMRPDDGQTKSIMLNLVETQENSNKETST